MTSFMSWLLSLGSPAEEVLTDPSWSQISDAFHSLDGQSPRSCWLSLTSPQQQSLIICGGHSLRFLVLFHPRPPKPALAHPFPTRSLQALYLFQSGPDLPLCLQPPLLSPSYATLPWSPLLHLVRHFWQTGLLLLHSPQHPQIAWSLQTDPPPSSLPTLPPPQPDWSSPSTLFLLGPSVSQPFLEPDWFELSTALCHLDGQTLTHAFFSRANRGTLAVLGGFQQRYAVFFFPHNQHFPVETLLAFDPSLAGPDIEVCSQPPTSSPARTAVQQPLAWRILQHFYHTQTIPRDVHWLLDGQPNPSLAN
ncbi:hypothetical protein [Thermogemmatispora onikobensis]|uniref:hypothetical protein n=1 Tax=Thermogemmatispora onikobensis TaxID=732234 RepID=UPI00114C9ED0|nr:hypothetical protein [Thermogemmatispora onikobensis]